MKSEDRLEVSVQYEHALTVHGQDDVIARKARSRVTERLEHCREVERPEIVRYGNDLVLDLRFGSDARFNRRVMKAPFADREFS